MCSAEPLNEDRQNGQAAVLSLCLIDDVSKTKIQMLVFQSKDGSP